MNSRAADLSWVDERLKAWARYFKDRHHYQSCGSLEKFFRATSEVCEAEGWGEPSVPRAEAPLDLRSVLQTHDGIHTLSQSQRWAITYGYCYPGLERWRVLKLMRKYTGRRFTWNEYLGEIEIGRFRVAAYLLTSPLDRAQSSCA